MVCRWMRALALTWRPRHLEEPLEDTRHDLAEKCANPHPGSPEDKGMFVGLWPRPGLRLGRDRTSLGCGGRVCAKQAYEQQDEGKKEQSRQLARAGHQVAQDVPLLIGNVEKSKGAPLRGSKHEMGCMVAAVHTRARACGRKKVLEDGVLREEDLFIVGSGTPA